MVINKYACIFWLICIYYTLFCDILINLWRFIHIFKYCIILLNKARNSTMLIYISKYYIILGDIMQYNIILYYITLYHLIWSYILTYSERCPQRERVWARSETWARSVTNWTKRNIEKVNSERREDDWKLNFHVWFDWNRQE